MSAVGPNTLGCYPHDGECLVHSQGLICASGCASGNHEQLHDKGLLLDCGSQRRVMQFIRDFKFDAQPEQRVAGPRELPCIACGRRIAAGDLVTDWEEGPCHAGGCLGSTPPKDRST